MDIPASLDTSRLVIRRFEKEDFESFYAFLADPTAIQYLTLSEGELNRENAKAFFFDMIESYGSTNPIFGFAVTEKSSGDYVGAMGLTSLKDREGSETIFIFLPKYWRKGYATEAGLALFDYAFKNLGVKKIVSFLSKENAPGIRLAEKLEMKFDQMVEHREYSEPVKRYIITRKN